MNVRATILAAFHDEVPNFEVLDSSISTVRVQNERVRVSTPNTSWAKDLEKKFNVLTSLRKGWDGYVGLPVSFSCANFAVNIIERLYTPSLPPPQLVPMPDGTIRLEWHMNQYDLEIDVLAPYEVIAFRSNLVTGREEEIAIETDFTELATWLTDLAAKRSLAGSELKA